VRTRKKKKPKDLGEERPKPSSRKKASVPQLLHQRSELRGGERGGPRRKKRRTQQRITRDSTPQHTRTKKKKKTKEKNKMLCDKKGWTCSIQEQEHLGGHVVTDKVFYIHHPAPSKRRFMSEKKKFHSCRKGEKLSKASRDRGKCQGN